MTATAPCTHPLSEIRLHGVAGDEAPREKPRFLCVSCAACGRVFFAELPRPQRSK